MRDLYLVVRYMRLILFLAIFLASLYPNVVHAQAPAAKPGAIRIQLSESMAASLETARVSRSADNILRTGIGSIDAANTKHKVSNLRRVFPPAGKFEAKHRKYGLHLWYEVVMDKNVSVQEALNTYRGISDVKKAEPVYEKAMIAGGGKLEGPRVVKAPAAVVSGTNDPMFGQQWHYDNTGQTGGTAHADINLLNAWSVEAGKPNVVVAITDGGVDFSHPDLKASAWTNTGEIAGNKIDDDHNGYVDDIHGYNFLDGASTITPVPHGTHVAGTIAATNNNGVGVSGVAGGSGNGDGVRIMSCQVFDDEENGDGFAQTYIYAADNGAVISQNSWGYTKPDLYEDAVLSAIDYFIAEAGKDANGNQTGPMSGGIVIFAAGNSGVNAKYYPGYYEPVLSVSATTHKDQKAYYSNYGTWVDIAAPGGETDQVEKQGILSTLPDNTYGFYMGTSMACPHVSGVAALVVSRFGGSGFTATQLRDRLVGTSDFIDNLNPDYTGALGKGRVNAFWALQENDNKGPDAITDLSVTDLRSKSLTLNFTAPADAGNIKAYGYEIRYSTSPITAGNFANAILLPGAFQAGNPGDTETIAVNDLNSDTKYYFAVRSKDIFSNWSALSNVAEQATFAIPVAEVSPASLSSDLLTAETNVKQFTLTNTGGGLLDFSITRDPYQTAFATFSPAEGSLKAGQSVVVDVTFDAHRLFGGEYNQTLTIASNDTVNTNLQVPVTLNVTDIGRPIVTFEPASYDFGGVFTGLKKTKTVDFFNEGSDTLKITSFSSNDTRFTSDFKGQAIAIPPFHAGRLVIAYLPTAVTASSAKLSVGVNDPQKPLLQLTFSGHGVVPPAMSVTPASLAASVPTAGITVQTLTINSTGQSALTYTAHAIPGKSDATFSKLITVTPSSAQAAGSRQYKVAAQAAPQTVTIRSDREATKPVRVLVISPDYNTMDFSRVMAGFKDLYIRPLDPSYLAGMTADKMSNYDVLIVTNNTRWDDYTSAAHVGDVLADFVDAGGKVIIGNFAYSNDASYDLEGRFIDANYGPLQKAVNATYRSATLGDKLQPAHPLLEGVNELSYDGDIYDVGLTDGSTALVRWSSGELLMAANNNVVAFNILASADWGFNWQGDLATMYHNAIHWLAGTPSMRILPEAASVAAGDQLALDVTFDATDLAGGTYNNVIYLSTDVPGKELYQVPATLTVRGPEFAVTQDSIWAFVAKGASRSRTITLTNKGKDAHTYTVRSVGGSLAPPQTTANSVKETEPETKTVSTRTTPYKGPRTDMATKLDLPKRAATASAKATAADAGYFTDFESFVRGDITMSPDGWQGQYSNWVAGTSNPYSGVKHFRGVSDGLGESYAFSAAMFEENNPYATVSMRVNFSHAVGASWHIMPYSLVSSSVVTRFILDADGVFSALVNDGDGNAHLEEIDARIPAGYFNLTIEVERSSGKFRILFDDDVVFTGTGFETTAHAVAFYSGMEAPDVYLDVDDFQVIDGRKETLPTYITVSPVSGTLAAGQSKQIIVAVNAADLSYGTYQSDVVVDVERVQTLTVPVTTDVTGAGAVVADAVPTVSATYHTDTLTTFAVHNTGGTLVNYKLKLAGADTTWLNLSAHKGIISKRDSVTITIDYASANLAPGTYTAQVLLTTNVPSKPSVTLPVTLTVLKPSVIIVTPSPVVATAAARQTVTQTVQIKNTGESPLKFNFQDLFTREAIKNAYTNASEYPKRNNVSVLYASGIEEFSDWEELNGQQNWTTDGGQWNVYDGFGDFYIESHTSPSESGVAYSPAVQKGAQPNSSMFVTVELSDVHPLHGTWQIIPQSVTDGKYVTKIQLRNRGVEVLTRHDNGEEVFEPVPFTFQEYDDIVIRVDAERATGKFTVYIDGEPRFHGQGATGNIEQIAIASLASPSDYLEIDDVMILDGALPWVSVSPEAGTVASGATKDITFTLDAQSLAVGNYSEVLSIASNDHNKSSQQLPVNLTVLAASHITIDKPSLEVTATYGGATSQSLAIGNTGGGTVNYSFSGVPAAASTGRIAGPDSYSYFWTDSDEPNGPAFDWIDIASTGTNTNMGDNDMRKITLPFAFNFYGKSYTEIFVKSDGLFGFGKQYSPEDDSNVGIPSTRNEPDNYFTPFWDYLSPGETGGNIYYQSFSDKFVVQFDDVYVWNGDEGNTFEVVLYPDGRIKFQYLSTVGSDKATVGIENERGDDGLQIAFNEAYLKNQLAILISPAPYWAVPSVTSGSVAGGNTDNVTVAFNAGDLAVGTYHSYLFIHSDDWASPLVSIPVTMNVVPTYTLSGKVTTAASAPLAGVTLSGFPGPVTTDANGAYSVVVPENWSGTITPSLSGYTFTPDHKDIAAVAANVSDVNFIGAVVTTGIDPEHQSVRVYPNPSDGAFWFSLPTAAEAHVVVYTTTGQIVLEADPRKEDGLYTFEVNRKGLFVLVIRTKDGVYTERIVVR